VRHLDCATHSQPGTPSTGTCPLCSKASCARCLDYDVDGQTTCHDCGVSANDQSLALGAAQLVFVAVAYLATLALGIVLFRKAPFVGGLAAVVAIAVGRVLQIYVRPPIVTPRNTAAR
jgi:hypothetical protein